MKGIACSLRLLARDRAVRDHRHRRWQGVMHASVLGGGWAQRLRTHGKLHDAVAARTAPHQIKGDIVRFKFSEGPA